MSITEPPDARLTKIREPRKKKLFDQLVERDGALCQHCGTDENLTLDHVDPEGPTILANLQLLCGPCNASTGTRPEKTVRWSETVWQRGFTAIPNTVLLSCPLSAGALRIYALFIHFSYLPDDKWPGQGGLAELAQCSERSLRDAVRELESVALVKTRRRGLGKTNCYVLLTPREPRPADSAGQDRRDTPPLEGTNGAGPTRARHKSGSNTTANKGANAPLAGALAPEPDEVASAPKLVKVGGRNLPVDALCKALGIDPASPQVRQAVAAVQDTRGVPGIRSLYWVECQRVADAHGDVGREHLAAFHDSGATFEETLANRIAEKVKTIRERQPWRTFISPQNVRDLWLDITAETSGGGFTAEELRGLR